MLLNVDGRSIAMCKIANTRITNLLLIFIPYIFLLVLNTHAQENPINLGAILLLSGEYSMQGAAFREGVELAQDIVNQAGGIKGRSLNIIIEDSKYQSAMAHSAAMKLLNQDKITAGIISTLHETKSSGQQFEKAKVPAIVLWDSCPELDVMGDYIFGIGPWAPSTGEKSAAYALSELKAKSAVIVGNVNEWSISVGDTFQKQFELGGGSILQKISLNPGNDFRAIIVKIKALKPDVIYAPVTDNLIAFFKQTKDLGLTQPIITSDNLNEEILKNAGTVVEGIYQTQVGDPDSGAFKQFLAEYEKKFQKPATLPLYVAWAYDSVMLYAKAISEVGVNPQKIKDALYKVKDYDGASGIITFNQAGSSPKLVGMFRVIGGKLMPVERVSSK